MSGLENVEAAKVRDMSVTITKEEKRLFANAFLVLELVFFSLSQNLPKNLMFHCMHYFLNTVNGQKLHESGIYYPQNEAKRTII